MRLKPFSIAISGVAAMSNPINGFGGMLKLCSVSLTMILCMACLAPVKEDAQPLNSQVLAENSTMKKRLPLIERENDVLKKENLQQRMKVLDLESQIKQQGLQIDSLNDKYDKDMTARADQILKLQETSQKLQETSQKLEKKSSDRIQVLMSKNTALKARMASEIQDLKAQMAKQNDAHIQERKQIMQENAKREFDLTARLDNLKKILEAKDLEIASRKMAMDEIATKLGKTTTLAESLQKSRDAAAAELESAKTANAELAEKVNDLNKLAESLKESRDAATAQLGSAKAANAELAEKVNDLNKLVESLKESRDAAAAKLGSAKAANAELAKRVDALSKQLPTQDNTSSKTN